MKKLLYTSTMMMLLTACGQNQTQVATWASGAAPSDRAEAMETEVLKVEDAAVSQTGEFSEDAEALFKAGDQVSFQMSPTISPIAHGTAQSWLGCGNGRVKGGYSSDSKCGSALFNPTFSKQMNARFYTCAERAAARANIAAPKRIFMNHDGSYNNRKARNSSRLSMHAYARAIDIASFNLYDAGGKVTKISTNVRNYRGTTKVFYNEFRQCWKEAMPSTCKVGMTEYKGSIGIPSSALGGNKLHNDHIHLSYAPCAGK